MIQCKAVKTYYLRKCIMKNEQKRFKRRGQLGQVSNEKPKRILGEHRFWGDQEHCG